MSPRPEGRPEELLIAAVADLLAGLDHVAVGAASPIPGAGALLAQARSGGRMRVSILGSEAHNAFTDGGRELFDCAAQGRIDAFFLGGVQIDGGANVNLVGPGEYPRSKVRFPGSFGSAYLYFLIPRVILFVREHSRRNLVPHVDFVSAPGTSEPGVYRPGGPHALLTGRCLFRFDREHGRFALASVHPGHDAAEVREHTGFDFDEPAGAEPPVTAAPSSTDLALIHGEIGTAIAEVYPRFAAEVLGVCVTGATAS